MRVSLSVRSNGSDPLDEIRRLTALRETLPRRLAEVAGRVGTPAVLDEARAIRGTLSMSNNAKGRVLDATPIVRRGVGRSEVEIQATPRGAWTLVNDGAKAHVIRPKKGPGGTVRRTRADAKLPKGKNGRQAKRGKRQPAVRTPYGVFAQVNHPGTDGTKAWDRAMAAAEPAIIRAVEAEFEDAVLESVGL